MADLVDPTEGMTDAQLAERATKAVHMTAVVGSLPPHLRVAFWNDWNVWLQPPLERPRWVLVHDRPFGNYRKPLVANAPPWAY
eukprot:4647217-Heterocapsa_arctica.AAC.1